MQDEPEEGIDFSHTRSLKERSHFLGNRHRAFESGVYDVVARSDDRRWPLSRCRATL